MILDDPQHARSEAVIAAGDVLRDWDGTFWNRPGWCFLVTDEAGEEVCTLTVSGTNGQR